MTRRTTALSTYERGSHDPAGGPPGHRQPPTDPGTDRLDFWLDALLLVAYTLAYSLGFSGVGTHEWLGIGLGLALLVHLTLHWDWVIRTTRKLFSRGGRERFVWLVDLLLLLSMVLRIASGILTVARHLVTRENRTLYKAPRGVMSADDGSPLGSHDWTGTARPQAWPPAQCPLTSRHRAIERAGLPRRCRIRSRPGPRDLASPRQAEIIRVTPVGAVAVVDDPADHPTREDGENDH
jgi:hypothetical protein